MGLMLATTALMNVSYAQKEKAATVSGAAMYPSKNMVENAVNSADHTTLMAAVKAAGLAETLQEAGPLLYLRQAMQLLICC